MQARISHAQSRQIKVRQRDFQLAKANLPVPQGKSQTQLQPVAKPSKSRNQSSGRSNNKNKSKTATVTPTKKKKSLGLSQLWNPDNIQESLKSVGQLRTSLKTWLQYLQQADQLLETIYVTSSSLKDSGVLDKIVKQRGKNLTSDDFTNILVALMNSPVGSQVFKSVGGQNNSDTTSPTANTGTAGTAGSTGAAPATGNSSTTST